MALINNIYVLVEEESISNNVETVSHPTESGMPTSDMIRRKPIEISLSGVIANTDSMSAKTAIAKIKELQKSGSLIKYIGQAGTFKNLQIQSFDDSYTNKNFGGAAFDMSLVEIKTAKSAYVKPKTTTVQKKEISVGDLVTFLGGAVYVDSFALRAAATRTGGSKCKLTKISNHKSAKHIYHLISQDCKYGSSKYVYGWVDAKNVQGASSTTSNSSNGGTQQVQGEEKDVEYYTTKAGDCIYNIVNVKYKGKGYKVNKVIYDNPNAFTVKNDPTTLKIGYRLKLSK